MKIHFGLHLDGQRGSLPRDRLGEIVVGPLGLLDILETQLGLLRNRASASERIVRYRDCLQRCDSPGRFYHRSFHADEQGTAATLLAWRDAWYLHGWNGMFTKETSSRLKDLGNVETWAKGCVDHSLGERLNLVLDALRQRRTAIAQIWLHDPLEAFPKRWQEVLARLPAEAPADQFEHTVARGFLGDLQAALRSAEGGTAPTRLKWIADGSVTVVQAETRFLAGSWLAAQVGQECSHTLLVAQEEGEFIDGMLASASRARNGLREASAFRPTLQVLSLVLEILWEPLNFHGLLQFLIHPVCPVPSYARRKLAAKLADKPGIGGKAWIEALEAIDAHYGGPDAEQAKAVRDTIHFWVEHPRYSQDTGAPLDAVIERVGRLARYFQGRQADTDPASRIAFNAGFGQCRAMEEALRVLREQGATSIRPRQLQKLAAQATARGSENPLLVAEVGAMLAVTHPGAAIEQCERVVWWQLGMPVLPGAYPWSQAEIRDLAVAGVEMPSIADRLEHSASEWLRPIFAARTQLILVLPPKGEEVHPLWQMIEALVSELPVVSLEIFLNQPMAGMAPVAEVPLPRRRRWWRLPEEIQIPKLARSSFSSLEKLLFNPYHWLLEYPARLRPSRILSVSNEFLLFGNLAHQLVETFYLRPDARTMTDAEFDAWFETAFDRLVVEEGAVLLMPGRRADLEGFRIRLKNSVHELRLQLAHGNVISVQPELELRGTYSGGELIGFADLVLKKAGGERAIVDMKWSGSNKFSQKLRENRHLQLAIYAELLRQKHGSWPSVGYYILDCARLLAADNNWFPSAEVVRKTNDENTACLWQRFIATWKWRQVQIAEGRFEVALEGIQNTDDSIHPEAALGMEYLSPAYNDYLVLAGWEEQA